MEESATLFCRQCRNIFKLSMPAGSPPDLKACCPLCGSSEVEESPAWAPLGSGSNIFINSEWEYECQECRRMFKMPIPESPSEEKERECPSCKSRHIHRLNMIGGEPLYCG